MAVVTPAGRLRDEIAGFAEFELVEPSAADIAQVRQLITNVAES